MRLSSTSADKYAAKLRGADRKGTGVKRDRIAYLLLGGATILVVCVLAAAVLYGPLP